MKNTIDLVFTLKKVPLFTAIPDHILAEVARLIEVVDIKSNVRFIKKSAIADGLYVIKSGRVKVHTDEVEICQLAENDIVGELGVLAPIRRSAHVTSMEPCILYLIHREYFIQLMNEIPEIVAPILHVLTNKIINTNEAFMDIRGQME